MRAVTAEGIFINHRALQSAFTFTQLSCSVCSCICLPLGINLALKSFFCISLGHFSLTHTHRSGKHSHWLTMKCSMLSLVRLVLLSLWIVPLRTSSCSDIRSFRDKISSCIHCSCTHTHNHVCYLSAPLSNRSIYSVCIATNSASKTSENPS